MGTHHHANCHKSLFLAVDRSHGSVHPHLAELNSRLAGVSADLCMKLCDDTPSVAMPLH